MILSCLANDVVWDMPGAFHLVRQGSVRPGGRESGLQGQPTITITRMVEEDDVVVAEGAVQARRVMAGCSTLSSATSRDERRQDPPAHFHLMEVTRAPASKVTKRSPSGASQ
jgi:hypothetical protein